MSRCLMAKYSTPLESQETGIVETQLMRRVALGDVVAFGELYDLYSEPLYAFAVLAIKDHREAEDILEDVFVKMWETAPTFNAFEEKPFYWALKIARNHIVDRFRSRKEQATVVDLGSTAVLSNTISNHVAI